MLFRSEGRLVSQFYGYNGCSGYLPENCETSLPSKIITLDRKKMTAEFLPGIVIPLKPFYGSIGIAPAPELGRVSSNPPGRHAGNLDNRELTAVKGLGVQAAEQRLQRVLNSLDGEDAISVNGADVLDSAVAGTKEIACGP